MSRVSSYIARWPVFLLLLSAGLILAGQAAAAVVMVDPADIILEGTSPYYQPVIAVVPSGKPIRWLNATGSPHSVRHDGCATEESCAFESVAVPPDSSILIAPLPPGRYTYHCELHPVMRGTLVVIDRAAQDERDLSAFGLSKDGR
jgi:plastocyanin